MSVGVDSVSTLIERMSAIAVELGDQRAQASVRSIQGYQSGTKLQIVVVGLTGSGRSSVLNVMLRTPGLLPESPIPKAPLTVCVQHGTFEEALIVPNHPGRGGGPRSVPVARLRDALTEPHGPALQYVIVRAPSRLLQLCDLKIEPLELDPTEKYWEPELGVTDFVVLVLNATALLALREREFVHEYLVPFGLQRVAIVINQLDLIPAEERGSLTELVRTFLGAYESQPLILEVSASDARAEAGLREHGHTGSLEALTTLMDDLVEQYGELRRQTVDQGISESLDELESAVERQRAVLSVGQEEADRVRATIAGRRAWLAGRIERVQHRVDAFAGTLIKERLQHNIEGYAEMLHRRLPEELMLIEDLSIIRKHLPGYIETLWTEFLHYELIAVEDQVVEETVTINRMIETDLRDLLNDAGGLSPTLRDFEPFALSMRPFVLPRRGQHRAEGVSRNLGLHGYVMLIFNPPLGAISLGASHLIRRYWKGDIDRSTKQALGASAIRASRELEAELRAHIDREFAALSTRLKDSVTRAYQDTIDGIEQFLHLGAAYSEDAGTRRERLEIIAQHTVPELRARFDALDARESA